jgi:predicted DNA-binding protein with PD1-like motif
VFQAAQGNIKRVVAFRLPPGEDVMEGLKKACDENHVNNGIILSCIGSLDGAVFYNPVPLSNKKAGYGYGEELVLRGPIELVNASGMICHDDNGEVLLHVHCTFSDQHGNAHGGHLIAGTKVLLTVDFVIAELDGINMARKYDDDLEVYIFRPEQAAAK